MDECEILTMVTRNQGATLFLTATTLEGIAELHVMASQLEQLVVLLPGNHDDGDLSQQTGSDMPPVSSSSSSNSSAVAAGSPASSSNEPLVLPGPPVSSQQQPLAAPTSSLSSPFATPGRASRALPPLPDGLPSPDPTPSRPAAGHSLLAGAAVVRDPRRSSSAPRRTSSLQPISEACNPSGGALPEASTSAPPPLPGVDVLASTSSGAPPSSALHSPPRQPASSSASPPRQPVETPPGSASPTADVVPSDSGSAAQPPAGPPSPALGGRAAAEAPATAAEQPFADSHWVPVLYQAACHLIFIVRLILLVAVGGPLLGLKAAVLWCWWALFHRAGAAAQLWRVCRLVAVKVWWAVAVGLAHLFYGVFYVVLETVPFWPATCWYYGVDLMALPFVEQRIMVASGGLLGLITCIAVPVLLLHGLHLLATVTQLAGNSQFTLVKDIGVGLFAHANLRRGPRVTSTADMPLDYYISDQRSESGAFLGPALVGLEPDTVLYLPTGSSPAAARRPAFYLRQGRSLRLAPVGVQEPYLELSTAGLFELVEGHTADHIARFLPPTWQRDAPFSLVVRLMLPSARLALVLTFSSRTHPASAGPQYLDQNPMRGALYKFFQGTDAERRKMLLLHTRVVQGSWLLSSRLNVSYGLSTTIPLGQRMRPTFYGTDMYLECDIDLGSGVLARALTQQACEVAKDTVLDLGFGLDGDGDDLAGQLLGGVRLQHLDLERPAVLLTTVQVAVPPLAAAGGSVELRERTMSNELGMESEGRRSRRATGSPPRRTSDAWRCC